MSAQFFVTCLQCLTTTTFITPPALLIFIKRRKMMSAFPPPLLFCSHSRFPECFLGAVELQWHCTSRVRVAQTRCRSSLVDFSQSISPVSSQMICSLSELLEVVDFDAALMKTFGVIEFANANLCLNVGPQAGVLGVSRTWSGWPRSPEN